MPCAYAQEQGGSSAPDFAIELDSASLTLPLEGSDGIQLTVTPINGFTGEVSLTLERQDGSAAPQGITLSPSSVTVSGSTAVKETLTVSLGPAVQAGGYPLRIKAAAGNMVKTANLNLTVSPIRWLGPGAAYDVTGDGRYVVGTLNGKPFVWSQESGLQIVGTEEGALLRVCTDGTRVAAVGYRGSSGDASLLWTAEGGLRGLPAPYNRCNAAYGCTFAGGDLHIVGRTYPEFPYATYWKNGELQWYQRFGIATILLDISPDASFGVAVDYRTMKLIDIPNKSGTTLVPGGVFPYWARISRDGSTILGNYDGAKSGFLLRGSGFGSKLDLDFRPLGISYDGRIVVGTRSGKAQLWTETEGPVDLNDLFPGPWALDSAYGITDSGGRIVGVGSYKNVGQAFIADLVPTVRSTDPANGATDVPVNKTITVTFNKEVQQGSAFDEISLRDASGDRIAVTKSIAGKVLSIIPQKDLKPNTTYTVTVPAGGVKDLTGNPLAADYTFRFTTAFPEASSLLRFVEAPPAALVVGEPFSVRVAVYDREGRLQENYQGNLALRVVGASLEGEPVTAPVQAGVAAFENLCLKPDSPVGSGFALVVSDPANPQVPELRKEGLKIARLLFTSDPAKAGYAAWPLKLPAPGAQGRDNWNFARVTLSSWGLQGQGVASAVYLAGSPDGTAAPAVDDTVRIEWWSGGRLQREDVQNPDRPVVALSAGRYAADVVLRNAAGSYGTGDVYALALDGACTLSARPGYEPDALEPVKVELRSSSTNPVAGDEVTLTAAASTQVPLKSLYLELVYSADQVVFQEPVPEPGVRLTKGVQSAGSQGEVHVTYNFYPAGSSFIENGTSLFTWKVRLREGSVTLRTKVISGTAALLWVSGGESSLTLTVAPRPTALVEKESFAFDPNRNLVLTLSGFGLADVDKVVLEREGGSYASTSVTVQGGTLTAQFGQVPLGLYSLRLFAGQTEKSVDSSGRTAVAVPPALPFLTLEIGSGSGPINAAFDGFHTDVLLTNSGTVDAAALLVLVAEPWVTNFRLDSPAWLRGLYPGSEPVLPQLLAQGEKDGNKWYLVRVDVPAGKKVAFVARRGIAREAIMLPGTQGQVPLGARVVPIWPKLISYVPKGLLANAGGAAEGIIREALKWGWLSYAEALCHLDEMPVEQAQAYLKELGNFAPELAEGLLTAHLHHLSDLGEEKLLGGAEKVYDSGENLINSLSQTFINSVGNFLSDNAYLADPGFWAEWGKQTLEGFADGRNADALVGLAQGTIKDLTFGYVDPDWGPVFGNEYDFRVGQAIGVAHGAVQREVVTSYFTGKVLGKVLEVGAVGASKLWSAGVSKITGGRTALSFKVGKSMWSVGYNGEKGWYLYGRDINNEAWRLFIGALESAPRAGGKFRNLVKVEFKKLKEICDNFLKWYAPLAGTMSLDQALEEYLNLAQDELIDWLQDQASTALLKKYLKLSDEEIEALNKHLSKFAKNINLAQADYRSTAREVRSSFSATVGASYDPNDIQATPAGVGEQGWIRPDERLTYLIRFENEGNAPAKDIRVELELDPNLDESTLKVEGSSHLEYTVDPDVLEGVPEDQRQQGNEYTERMRFSYDPATRKLTWFFPNILLPDKDNDGANDGFVLFSVAPRESVAHAAYIQAQASIYFDSNPPVETNVEARTVDREGPRLSLGDLPATASGPVTVTWTGVDDGAGLDRVYLLVARDGGEFTLYQVLSPDQKQVQFQGEPGHRYAFKVYGVDLLGNRGPDGAVKEVRFLATSTGGTAGGGGGGGGYAAPAGRVEKRIIPAAVTVAELSGRARVEVSAGAVKGANARLVLEESDASRAAGAGMAVVGPVVDIRLLDGELTGKVTVTLHFDRSRLPENCEPAIFYYDEKEKAWRKVDSAYDLARGTVTAELDHLTMFTVFAVPKEAPKLPVISFKDMQGHWAEATVARLAAMGVVSGYPDGTFKPDNEITRAEVTAILARALKLSPGKEEDLKFADKAAIPAWAKGVIAAAAKEGLVKGYPQPDGTVTFEADRPLSRVEMAVLAVRILEKKAGKVTPAELKFADAEAIPDWAKASVGVAVAKGIVAGYPDNTFRPDQPVTRAEASAMILRLLDALGSK
ncbi:S-layer homology domain-containing protein [Ammonifex thiophilus]|nr:S-layer homology domain-containing protein [Ammonifex thiophilus]